MVGNSLVVPDGLSGRFRSNSRGSDKLDSVSQPSQSSQQQVVANVATSNIFETLDLDVLDNEVSTQQHPAEEARRIRCPPIFVYGKTVTDVNKLVSSLGIDQKEYLLRLSKGNIQIAVKSKQHFVALLEVLKSKNIQFYTHGTSDETPVKIVLAGLPLFDVDELKVELKNNEIEPSEVKLLTSSKTGDSAIYLLQFAKGTVKLQELRKTRSLFNVIVSWRMYIRRKADVVQCFRCQQFGHGMRNCNLQAKCVKCGELHNTQQCKLPAKSELNFDDEVHKSKVRCANCSQNHTANYKGCPTRLNYIKSLESRNKNRSAKPAVNTGRPQKATAHVQQAHASTYDLLSAITNPGGSYVDVVRNGSATTGHQAPGNSSENSLFTIEEFMALANELFTRLSTCRSKAMQFLALSELTIKYVYNG